jgi:hypothetical protein
MITDWLKLVLIQQFFSLLAADGSNDTRRLKFWERYHESIHDMYFALGSTARRHRGRDFQDIRKKMEGRLLNLHSAGSPDNNAFIMCIGNHVVVEFGLKGNACYIFKSAELPFDLSGEIAGNGTELKHQSGDRLLHQDGSWEPWERKFQNSLASRMRVRPVDRPIGNSSDRLTDRGNSLPATPRSGVAANEPRAAVGQTANPRQLGIAPEHTRSSKSFEMSDLRRLCDGRGIRVQDLRDRNGNLWVLADDGDGYVCGQLRDWGFTYKADKGWWWK